MPESALLWSGTACYGFSAAGYLWPAREDGFCRRASFYLLAIGVFLLAFALTQRWIRIGHGPFLTMYEVLLSNAFSIGFIYAIIFSCIPLARLSASIVLPTLFLLGLWATHFSPEAVPLPPTFDNYWLWLHVLSGKIFLGCCLTASALSLNLFLNHINLRATATLAGEQVIQIDKLIWQFIAVAFVCDSFMLLAGSIWAYTAWGRYWNWDPLETWAFITWLALAIVLHLRITFNIPQWSGWWMVIGIFCLAFLTFFGVPFFSLAPHKGIM